MVENRAASSHRIDHVGAGVADDEKAAALLEHVRQAGRHLPVQSGSDGMLRAMRRGYTVDAYVAKITRLRELVPDVALSTDIIVGFPGETGADFEATCALMERVRYDSAFVFKYSPRPGTEAAAWPDDVPQPVKERRNQILLEMQARISRETLESWIGREVEVLVEERNRRGQLTGKSRRNTTVVLEGPDALVGELVAVRVDRVTPTTMIGELADRAALAVAASGVAAPGQ